MVTKKPSQVSQPFGTLEPYEPGLLEGIGARLQDFMVDRAGISRPVARDLAGAVGFSRPEEAPLMRATDVLGGPAGVAVAGADFMEDPSLLTGIGVPIAAIPFIGGPIRRGIRGMGGNGGPPIDDDGFREAVEAAREGRKAAAKERARIKPEAERTILDQEYIANVTSSYAQDDRLVDETGITSVSKVRQELESIGMGKNPWSKQKVVKELNKRGVTKDQMEASGITALLDRKPNVTKEELVAQHERFAPQITVESRSGNGTQWAEQQRVEELGIESFTGTGVEPLKTMNYSEVVFRNENPELGAGFRSSQSHGMGGSKGSKGEIAHARTSEYMLPGTGRVELIEEVQSDLHKVLQTNKAAGDPAKKLKAVRTSIRNNEVYANAMIPKAEEAADMIDDWLMKNDSYPSFSKDLKETSKQLRAQAKGFQDSLDNLNSVVKNSPDDLDAIREAHGNLSVARSGMAGAWTLNDNSMYEISNLADRMGDKKTSDMFGNWRTNEGIAGQGRLTLPVRDATSAANAADTILATKTLPMMSPRVVELADSPRFQEISTKLDDLKRSQRAAQRDADNFNRVISDNRDNIKQVREEIDRINERATAGINDDSVFPPDTSMEMRQRILNGDVTNRKRLENRLRVAEDRIREANRKYDKADQLSRSYLSSIDTLKERIGTSDDEIAAFSLIQQRKGSLDPTRKPVNPAMPFDSLNDVTQFVYETMFERAIKNPNLNGVVLPDYRDIANVPSRGTSGMDEAFKIGYEDAPKAVIKRFKERYPDLDVTTTEIPGANYPAVLIKFPKKRGTGKPLIQGYAQGGLVMKGIGSIGKEVL